MISRKCSGLPNIRAKGIGHPDGSLPFITFSELYYCNLTGTCLSSSRACSAQVGCLIGSPLEYIFLSNSYCCIIGKAQEGKYRKFRSCY